MRPIRKFLRIYNGFILPMLLLLVSAAVIFWGVLPGINSIKALFAEMKTLNKEVDDISKRVKFLEGLDEQTLQLQMEGLLSAVPPDKSLPTFFSSLEAVAYDSGITIIDFAIDAPGTISTPSGEAEINAASARETALTANINIGGNLDQIKTFFDKLIAVRRLFNIQSMAMNFKADSDTVSSGLTVNAFFAPLPPTLGKASAPIDALTVKEEDILNRVLGYPLVNITNLTGGTLNIEVGNKEDPFSLP